MSEGMPVYLQITLTLCVALMAGLNACIVYILSDVKSWLKALSGEFHAHVTDWDAHNKK